MERIFKKLIAIIILILMMFASCSQTISYAVTIYARDSKTTIDTEEDINEFASEDVNYDGNGELFCLQIAKWMQKTNTTYTEHNLEDYLKFDNYNDILNYYNKLSDDEAKENFINTFKSNIGIEFRSYIGVPNDKKKTDNVNLRTMAAIIWLAKNVYVNENNNTENKNLMIEHLKDLIRFNNSSDNWNVYYDKLDDLSYEQIRVIEQLAFWRFTKKATKKNDGNDWTVRDKSSYTNLKAIIDLDENDNNGVKIDNFKAITGFESDEKYKTAYYLFMALCKGALNNWKSIKDDTNVSVNNDNKNIIVVNEANHIYRAGPIKFDIKDLGLLKIKLDNKIGNINITDASLTDKNGNVIKINNKSTEIKNIHNSEMTILDKTNVNYNENRTKIINNAELYITFKTQSKIQTSETIKLKYEYEMFPTLKNITLKSYTQSLRQPLIEIQKTLNKTTGQGEAEFSTNITPIIDIALTKQIDKVFNYDGTKFNVTYNSKSKNSSRQGADNDQYAPNMIKQPEKVCPGDIIRYKFTIYNEGNFEATVKEVTDYLPEELEFLNVSNVTFSGVTNDNNSEDTLPYYHNAINKEKLSYDATNRTIKYNIPNPQQKLEVYGQGEAGGNNTISFYLECQVISNINISDKQTNNIIYNIAEVTDYGYTENNNYVRVTTINKKDRDSEPGTINNKNNNFSDYKTKLKDCFDTYNKNIAVSKGSLRYQGNMILQDDEDFECIELGGFDLALRKYITKIEDANGTVKFDNATTKNSRTPNYEGNNKYRHYKYPLKVENGDIVTYKIRIINEGYLPGNIKQIYDYLPSTLSLESSTLWKEGESNSENVNAEQKFIELNTNNSEYTNISNKLLKPAKYGESLTADNYIDIELKCKVNVQDFNLTYITNVAEITNYAYITGKYETNGNLKSVVHTEDFDVDSIKNNVFTERADITDIESYREKEIPDGIYGNHIGNAPLQGIEDDDDFEILEIGQKFDLALRKFITKVGDTDVTGREPKIAKNEETDQYQYEHLKDPVTVKPGDTVHYKFRIYNEGTIDGVVKEIVDYLPSGLQLATSGNTGWSVDSTDNGITKIIYTPSSEGIDIPHKNGNAGFDNIINKQNNNQAITDDDKFWKDIDLYCTVTEKINNETLVNVAEITNYGYKKGTNYIEAKQKDVDIDSIENNVFNDNINLNYYYDKNKEVTGSKINYSYEDDDDFEAVIVESIDNYDIELLKQDASDNSNLQNVKFDISKYDVAFSAQEVQNLLNNGISTEYVNDNRKAIGSNNNKFEFTTNTDGIIAEESVNNPVASSTQIYKITETKSASNYENDLDGYCIGVPVYIDSENKLRYRNKINEQDVTYGKNFLVFREPIDDSGKYTLVKNGDEDFNIYDKVSVEIQHKNTESEKEKLKITIKNTKVDPGKYKILLRKMKRIATTETPYTEYYGAGFEFNVTGKKYKADGTLNGDITLEADNSSNRFITNDNSLVKSKEITMDDINAENTTGCDVYEITEVIDPSYKFKGLGNDKIYVYVYKKMVDNQAVIDKISLTEITAENPDATDRKQYNNNNVYVRIYPAGNTININVRNAETYDKFSLNLKKHGDSKDVLLGGAEFEINENNEIIKTGTTESDETNKGLLEVFQDKKFNTEQYFKYTIYEEKINNTDYKKLDEPVIVHVWTHFNETTGKYSIDYSLDENNKSVHGNANNDNVWLEMDSNNLITVHIKNQKIEGSYRFRIKKRSNVGPDYKELAGVPFKIKKNNTYYGGDDKIWTTNSLGVLQLNDQEIKLSSFEEIENEYKQQDIYEIEELDYANYQTLQDKVKLIVSVTKNEGSRTFTVTSKFDDSDREEGKKQYETTNNQGKTQYNLKVKLKDGKEVVIYTYVNNDMVILAIRNLPDNVDYNMQIQKVDKDLTTTGIKDVKFMVNRVTSDSDTESETPISENGYTTGADGKTDSINIGFTKENFEQIDKFKIYEFSSPSSYIGLNSQNAIPLYVKKGIVNETDDIYGATGISFDDSESRVYEKSITKENVTLSDNTTKVNITASIDVNGDILIVVPNKHIEGSYSLKLLKVKPDSSTTNGESPLSGISFAVKQGNTVKFNNQVTDTNGLISIINNETITENSLGETEYEIIENTTSTKYLKLKNSIKVYVNKYQSEDDNQYVAEAYFKNANNEHVNKINAELADGSNVEVRIETDAANEVIKVVIPNKEIEGKYGIELIKTDEAGNNLSDGTEETGEVKFTVKRGTETLKNAEKTINGKLTIVAKDTEITELGTEVYEIAENSTLNSYIKLAESIKLYVTKKCDIEPDANDPSKMPTKYVAKVSFTEGMAKNRKDVAIVGGGKVTVTASIDSDGVIKVTVPNKEIKGKYSMKLVKTVGTKVLNGAKFEAYTGDEVVEESKLTLPKGNVTGENGNGNGEIQLFEDKQITKDNIETVDSYTIKEITTAKGYVALPEEVTVYVFKGLNAANTEYIATDVSFNKENKKETTKNVTLPNGKEVTLSARIEDGVVILTIPNEKMEGQYDLELIKIDQKDNVSPLKGVTFDIKVQKEGNNGEKENITLTDINDNEIKTANLTTDENGKIVLKDVKITEGNTYYITITETKGPKGYVLLKDPVVLTYKTKVDETVQKYVLEDVKVSGVADVDSTRVTTENNTNKITVTIKNGQFDLALRKFITSVVVGAGTQEEKKVQIPNRVPVFVRQNNENSYVHSKERVMLGNENVVEYTIRVYNEGSIAGYAKEVKDDIPEGLEFLPDNKLNKEYGWKLLDEKGNEVTDVNKAKYIVTNYLSKEEETKSKENGQTGRDNLIKAFNVKDYEDKKITEPYYKEVKVAFKVNLKDIKNKTEDERNIINRAEVSDDEDENGDDVTDVDSTPDEWIEGDDDQDTEVVTPQYFDLALNKYVSKAIVIEDGKETVRETGYTPDQDGKQDVVKVDLKDSKINNVVVKFEYKIRITNEGEIAGYAKEISDYIPEGLRFDAADNPEWKEIEGKVVTSQLENKLLQPGENAEVSIILTWINRKDNLGLKQNVAEISKDYNVYQTPDIDSTPDNQVPGEDDIDDAEVMLTVKTGEAITYIGLTTIVLVMLVAGIVVIKKKVL